MLQTYGDYLVEQQLGKLGQEDDEEVEPATGRRTKPTDLGSDLGERDGLIYQHILCHALALIWAMTDEARWEAEI